MKTLKEQWEAAVEQLVSGLPEKARLKKIKKLQEMYEEWKQLKGYEDRTKISLKEHVIAQESEAHRKFQREDKKEVGFLARKKHEKEVKRLREEFHLWHSMAVSCVALVQLEKETEKKVELKKSDVKEKETNKIQEGREIASIYPVLPPTAPPPYAPPHTQLPVLEVQKGVLDMEQREGNRWKIKSGKLDLITEKEMEEREIARETAELMRTHREQAAQAEQRMAALEKEIREQWNSVAQERTFQPRAQSTPGETLSSRFITVDETGSQIEIENQVTYPVEIRGEMRMGTRRREESKYNSSIKTPKKEQEREEQEYRELGLIRGIPNMCPLVDTNGNLEYKPWSFTDMGAILAKLPHITSGGGKWIGKVISLTQGHTLAIGDLRALLGQVLTVGQITEIEREAGTVGIYDDHPYCRVASEWGKALRKLYPAPAGTLYNIKFSPKGEETAAAYLSRCKGEWEEHTGAHPHSDKMQEQMFRAAVLEGTPKSVQDEIKANPDLPGAVCDVWERHFLHHMSRANEKEKEKVGEVEELKKQLLRLQLQEARSKINEEKEKKKDKQMVVQEMKAPPRYTKEQEVDPSNVTWERNTQRPIYYSNRGRGGDYNRGRGRVQYQEGCFRCGRPGHFVRDCRQPELGAQQRPSRGRGHNPHMAPNVEKAPRPHSQYPLSTGGEREWY
nr:uncharacterized protein LOC129436522 [Misgurnus anguillicaudatus]